MLAAILEQLILANRIGATALAAAGMKQADVMRVLNDPPVYEHPDRPGIRRGRPKARPAAELAAFFGR